MWSTTITLTGSNVIVRGPTASRSGDHFWAKSRSNRAKAISRERWPCGRPVFMSRIFGGLTAHAVGSLMKEAVRRAIVAIRGERFSFEAQVKRVLPGGSRDLVTTADQAAQRVFVKLLRDWFPTYGVVAEENHLSVPCTEPDHDFWFTVDPLDGTKAFIRRQSHGIGTMLALVCDGDVIAACVGDVMTQEVYATRPDSPKVFRISEFGVAEKLEVDKGRTLRTQWIQLRDPPSQHSPMVDELAAGPNMLFSQYEIVGGSIGISMARLWKGEVAAEVIRPGWANPWDLCPVVGISRKLGFVFVQLDSARGNFQTIDPPIARSPVRSERELLVIHHSRVGELEAWLANRPTR